MKMYALKSLCFPLPVQEAVSCSTKFLLVNFIYWLKLWFLANWKRILKVSGSGIAGFPWGRASAFCITILLSIWNLLSTWKAKLLGLPHFTWQLVYSLPLLKRSSKVIWEERVVSWVDFLCIGNCWFAKGKLLKRHCFLSLFYFEKHNTNCFNLLVESSFFTLEHWMESKRFERFESKHS